MAFSGPYSSECKLQCLVHRRLLNSAFGSKMRSNVISCLLVCCLEFTQLHGQSLAAASLRITVVEGEAVIHNIRQPVPRDLVVRVEDENRRPVARANASFTLPAHGDS